MSRRQIIAFDIETCPQPESSFSETQQARFDKLLRRRRGKNVDESLQETRVAARALSPYLGWICCISVCRLGEDGEPREANSWAQAAPQHEERLLKQFWKDLLLIDGPVTWVSFNGKKFDTPYLRLRSLACGAEPSAPGILNTHKWRDEQHTDLWRYADGAGLDDYCDLLGVPNPKEGMDGSEVWPAVQEGRLDDVARYCEKDALATLRCYLRSRHTFA